MQMLNFIKLGAAVLELSC